MVCFYRKKQSSQIIKSGTLFYRGDCNPLVSECHFIIFKDLSINFNSRDHNYMEKIVNRRLYQKDYFLFILSNIMLAMPSPVVKLKKLFL